MLNEIKGVFAIRTPFRSNPIGISIFRLIEIDENFLFVDDLDILDKTPVLDIKPYIPQFDNRETKKRGWLEGQLKRKFS